MIVRDYYEFYEIEKKLGCDESDLLYLASLGEIDIGYKLDRFKKDDIFLCKVYVKDASSFNDWLISAKVTQKGFRQVSAGSSLEVVSSDIEKDDAGFYFYSYLRGFWCFEKRYANSLYETSNNFEYYPSVFLVESNSECDSFVIKAVPFYENNKDYWIVDNLYLSGFSYGKVSRLMSEKKQKYQSQSESQTERHSKPRVDILMALLSLVRKDPSLLNLNASKLAEKLHESSKFYWPDAAEPPLGFDAIRELISTSFKR